VTDKTLLLGTLLQRRTDATLEAEILGLLTSASTDELNDLIEHNEMHRLYDALDNHLMGPKNRDALIDLLARQRVGELTVMAAAGVVYAFQRGRTSRADEEAIRDVFLAFTGERLTRLKNQINARTDTYDLEGLVYSHVDDADLRRQILEHIATQATQVPTGQAKICIDIDDTTFSALHDKLWPKGTAYPGALAFYEALDDGPGEAPFSTGDLAFVTARPSDVFGLMHGSTRRALQEAGVADSSIEQGPLLGILSKAGMADGKINNLRHLGELYPEYELVFLGDSGQGDVIVAEKIRAEFGDRVRACFIHDVVDTPDAERARLAE